jgi:hypothetical protein
MRGPPPFNTDRERAKESLRRLAVPSLTTVCFGHGEPLHGDRTVLLQDAATAAEIPDPLGVTRPPNQAWLRAYRAGVTEVCRRKWRVKWAWSWKPRRAATSAGRAPASSCGRAASIRRPMT